MTTQLPPPGWYPDPSGKPGLMYWDGQQWHTNVPVATAPAPYAAPTPGRAGGTATAEEAIERTYNAPPDRVWDALRATITDLGFKDVKEDRAVGLVEYRTGLSLSTWRGQQMTAVVRDVGGSTVVSLKGHVAFPQLISWGEKKRLAVKVLDLVEHRLSGAPTGPAPGWYPDPNDSRFMRYFDGRVWTASIQPRG